MWDTIIRYLHQPSTWRGLLSILISAGVFTMSPEVLDSTVANILLVIGALEGIKGTVNIVRDENKQKVTNVIIQTTNEPQSSADTANQLQSGKF